MPPKSLGMAMLDESTKRFCREVFAFRVDYPDDHEAELLEDMAADDDTAKHLAEFRAERAAGLCTLDYYMAKFPHIYELQAA